MPLKITELYNRDQQGSFNMTPMIDIVFLLIIFFLVVCKFIEAENFPVTVPDRCEYAESSTEYEKIAATVSVARTDEDRIYFAVGAEKIVPLNYTNIAEQLTQLINERIKDMPTEDRVVSLRIDKDICFAQAQYALAAVAASSATDIQLAALKAERTAPQ